VVVVQGAVQVEVEAVVVEITVATIMAITVAITTAVMLMAVVPMATGAGVDRTVVTRPIPHLQRLRHQLRLPDKPGGISMTDNLLLTTGCQSWILQYQVSRQSLLY
jgi:hypothetical protein